MIVTKSLRQLALACGRQACQPQAGIGGRLNNQPTTTRCKRVGEKKRLLLL